MSNSVTQNENIRGVFVKVISGPRQGEVFIIKTDGSLLIGRHHKSDIVITKDPAVSGKHALITWLKGNCYIEDLHSTNGTLLDGKTVNQSLIQDESFVTVGSTLLKINICSTKSKPKKAP